MKVKYIHQRPGVHTGNIIWAERDRGDSYFSYSRFAMKHGKFPPDHPAAPGSDKSAPGDTMQMGLSEPLTRFRARGYWASCFPEGDGITLDSGEKTPEQVVADIRECFGWEVEVHP